MFTLKKAGIRWKKIQKQPTTQSQRCQNGQKHPIKTVAKRVKQMESLFGQNTKQIFGERHKDLKSICC